MPGIKHRGRAVWRGTQLLKASEAKKAAGRRVTVSRRGGVGCRVARLGPSRKAQYRDEPAGPNNGALSDSDDRHGT
jgi:hypothetical protein